MKKIILFGCGQGGHNAYKYYSKKCNIVAFSDNNKDLYGTMINNIKVINPNKISTLNYDSIFISSMYREFIFKQLISELNISKDNIEFVRDDILNDNITSIFKEIFFFIFLSTSVYSLTHFLEYSLK